MAAQAEVPEANATPPCIYSGHNDCVNNIRASPVPEIKGANYPLRTRRCAVRLVDPNTQPLFSIPPPPNRAEFQSASFIPAPPNWDELMCPWDIESRACSRPPAPPDSLQSCDFGLVLLFPSSSYYSLFVGGLR